MLKQQRDCMKAAPAMIETLEGRTLLSSVSLTSGVLTITGNSTADRIEVQKRADKGRLKVEVNGGEREFYIGSVLNGGGSWPNVSSVIRVRAFGARQLTVTP
jgi:hypothetical protein